MIGEDSNRTVFKYVLNLPSRFSSLRLWGDLAVVGTDADESGIVLPVGGNVPRGRLMSPCSLGAGGTASFSRYNWSSS